MGCRTPLRFVRESVGSVLAQTWRDFEFLIIDDDGPPETREWLASLRDPRIRLLHHDSCQGIALTLNQGLRELEADIVFNLDADDRMHPCRLAWQMAFLRRHPEVAVLGGAMTGIDADGRPTGRRFGAPRGGRRMAYQLLWSSAINHPTVAYRREVVLAAGGYDPAYRTSMDYQLWTRLAPTVAMANLGRSLTSYRIHDGQAHRTSPAHAAEVRRSRLAYRARIAGLPEADTDETAEPRDWPARLTCYRRLAQAFPEYRLRRDLARRLLREAAGDPRAPRDAVRACVSALHAPTAWLARLSGKLARG